MEKELTSRQKQAIVTKQKIYKTGVAMFKEHGFQSVSVEEIAKKAGVGIGTFYHYYKSKLALYTDLFINAEDYFEEFKDINLNDFALFTILERFFTQYVRLNEEPGIEFATTMCNPEGRAILEGNQDFQKYMEQIIAFYQKTGVLIDSSSAKELCDYCFICARGVLFDWAIHNDDYELTPKMIETMQRVFKGIMKS